MKYKLRYFYSKAAFLVLVWIMLVASSMTFLYRMFTKPGGIQIPLHYKDQTLLLKPMIAFVPIAGWLADVQYGNFKVFRFGVLLLFVSTVLTCICQIIKEEGVHPTVTMVAIATANNFLLFSLYPVHFCTY